MKRITAVILALMIILMPCVVLAAEAEYTNQDAVDIAKVIYAEARGVKSVTEQAAVAWCILNRVDDERWGDTVYEVVRQKHQFAWKKNTPVLPKFYDLALDVLMRWELEKLGVGDAGRVLPKEYVYFAGRKGRNWFRAKYRSKSYWDFSLESPYESETEN